ncbi:MAG: universal stress protein [Betaproteobacteria bacterium]|nr:universal stress protein [Betaproteobacteria bacterium]
MAKKLLVPVDGSEHALNAVRYAVGRVREAPGELLVLHVEPPVSYEEMRVYVMREEAEKIRRQACERVLSSATRLLDEAKVAYSAHLREGEIAPTIAKFAEAEKVDEVILGTRGMSTVGELLLGSVAHRVVHLVRVPVTLVR